MNVMCDEMISKFPDIYNSFKGTLGVLQSESALLYTILYPRYARAWPGGCGSSKLGSNYGPTIRIQSYANKRGFQQVLWLYGPQHYVTEVGTMNIFMVYEDENRGYPNNVPLNIENAMKLLDILVKLDM
ncbi:hypothetical protein JTB14_021093 [Gonioctena quinquepunctata]|nr:hypothetical protein JTB14_021093 [Gonioctena quinquepunctata]